MSDSILIHGKRGSGKTLAALHLVQKYMGERRPVATNVDLFLEHLLHPSSKARAYRLPDHPGAEVLEALPLGNPALYYDDAGEIQSTAEFSEEKNGLLLLDEVATFLNSREWQGKGRAELISWLVQSRKYGWDLLFLAQHPRLIDAQIRESLIEIQGPARRLDKVKVPLLGNVWKWLTGKPLRFPKIHVVGLFYGFGAGAPLYDRWMFRGAALYKAYNTRQRISAVTGNQALYSYLSPWHLRGRYMGVLQMYRAAIGAAAVLGCMVGVGVGLAVSHAKPEGVAAAVPEKVAEDVTVAGVMREAESLPRLYLSNGRYAIASGVKADSSGERYLVDGTWYKVAK